MHAVYVTCHVLYLWQLLDAFASLAAQLQQLGATLNPCTLCMHGVWCAIDRADQLTVLLPSFVSHTGMFRHNLYTTLELTPYSCMVGSTESLGGAVDRQDLDSTVHQRGHPQRDICYKLSAAEC